MADPALSLTTVRTLFFLVWDFEICLDLPMSPEVPLLN